MREIKFRIFIKSSKRMEYAELRNLLYSDGYYYDSNQKANQEVMQYIGIKDKNGKEIYEGDIVKHENGVKVVYYDEDSASFQLDLSNVVMDQECGGYERVEIIGNIYETPNLLNNSTSSIKKED